LTLSTNNIAWQMPGPTPQSTGNTQTMHVCPKCGWIEFMLRQSSMTTKLPRLLWPICFWTTVQYSWESGDYMSHESLWAADIWNSVPLFSMMTFLRHLRSTRTYGRLCGASKRTLLHSGINMRRDGSGFLSPLRINDEAPAGRYGDSYFFSVSIT
jgi:hypothetical protein